MLGKDFLRGADSGSKSKGPSELFKGDANYVEEKIKDLNTLIDNSQGKREGVITVAACKVEQDSTFIKEVTPKVFYGSPVGKPLKRTTRLLRLLHEIHKDLAEELPSSSTRIWATFPRQDEAFQFADSHGAKENAVFAYQDHVTGQRRYLVTSYEEFWSRYSQMLPNYRHHYEIIRQGIPCHLYFDLEYNQIVNKEANGEAMVDLLVSVIAQLLWDTYALKYEPSWTVELDSTIEEKFSRHLIIHVPRVAFKDNSHAGAFTREVCNRVEKLRDIDQILNQLYVLKGDSRVDCQAQLFVDQAVYSRNRSFRLPFSSKAGKSSQLLPTRRFRCKDMNDRDVFMDSLICKVGQEVERLLVFSDKGADCGESLIIGLDPPFPSTDQFGVFNMSGMSPFPEVDRFIESVACIGNITGKIRSWYWFSDYGVVVYNISGNRYCEHIGRHHKSNHVMYIVDFRIAGYYQKCHDPDCKGFKSSVKPIPRKLVPPDFPLPAAVDSLCSDYERQIQQVAQSCYDANEMSSLQRFSSLSIVHEDKENVLHSESSCINVAFDDDDDDWWEQVIKSTMELERK